MKRIFTFIVIAFLGTLEIAIAANPFEKYKGCYEVSNFYGNNSFSAFKPQTLFVSQRKKSTYSLPDGSELGGLEFNFCINQGPVSVCREQTAYDHTGSYGVSYSGADYFLYGGDACEIDSTNGYSCGSLIESISISAEGGGLKIIGDRHSTMPLPNAVYKAGYSAYVKKIPLKNGLCR